MKDRSGRTVARAVWWPVMLALAIAIGAGAPLWPWRASAQEVDGARMEEIEREVAERRRAEKAAREAQARLAAEARGLSERLVEAAARLRRQEEAVAAAGAKLERLEAERDAVNGRLAARRESIVHTLAALERVSRQPPALLLARPGVDATASLRSAMLLGRLVPMLEEEAESLRAEIARLRALAAEIGAERRRLAADRDAFAAQQAALDRLLAEKRRQLASAESAATEKAAAHAQLAARAEDLRALIERLEREAVRPQPKPKLARAALAPPPRPQSPGRSAGKGRDRQPERRAGRGLKLLVPVHGAIVRGFGGRTELGGRSKGLEIAAAPQAYVLAPVAGQVVFAGPFRGYGQLLIISAGGGYHVLLAGLSSIDAVVGQSVLQGEPVARMPGGGGGADGVRARPRLYVELRSDGDPIDPAPWLEIGRQSREGKVSG